MKNRIIDIFLQKWYSTVTSSLSFTMYKTFKPQLCYESYLEQLSAKNRKLLAKFRLSSCKLNAITGKYENIDNNKLCKMCDLNDIVDKFHFVLVYPKYLILRQKYIKPYYLKKPSVYKLCEILNSNRNFLSNLC